MIAMTGTTDIDSPNARPSALVTGGAGFIGSHLVRQLIERGQPVRVLDLDPSPTLDPRAEFIQGSITDPAAVERAVDGMDWVFQLAADPNLWHRDKASFDLVNHEGARLVVEAAGAAGAKRIVYTSTESILKGTRRSGSGTVDESVERRLSDMPGPYCRAKYLGEQAAFAAAARGLPVIVVNPTLPVGPGDARLTPPTQMILGFLNGDNPAYLDFDMNIIHVADAALGHILAAEKGQTGERYILGGENLRLSEVLLILEELTGLPMPKLRIPYGLALAVAAVSEFVADNITRRPPRASLTGVRIAGAEMRFDNSKAVQELGLTIMPARQAIADAVAWLEDRNLVTRAFQNGRAVA
jgi:dihydroflavonol-4-reductase